MSDENVEVVRRGLAAWNAGQMDAIAEMHDPDAILRVPSEWPEAGPFVGREAVMRQWTRLRETWDADAVEPTTDYLDAGDRVVVRWRWWGQAHDGADWTLEITGVYTVRDGRFFHMEFFFDHDEALKAAGMHE